MKANDLTDAEQTLFDSLPGVPVKAVIRSTNIWIVEWLPSNEQRTGLLLHEWMEDRRPGWSEYSICENKQEVILSIERATNRAKKSGMIPVLHLEAHGDEIGLGGPNGTGGMELLTWDEFTEPLQRLNLMTRCNFVVVVASCIGFAGIKALVRGPRAPAVALVGPDAKIMTSRLLSATKEFYRLWMDENPNLNEIVVSASQQAGSVSFELEPFAVLAYDAMGEQLIVLMRQDQQRLRVDQFRQRMLAENRWSAAEIEHRLSRFSPSLQADVIQRLWDEMFMIDLYPDNQERFGVDWAKIVDMVLCNKIRFKMS